MAGVAKHDQGATGPARRSRRRRDPFPEAGSAAGHPFSSWVRSPTLSFSSINEPLDEIGANIRVDEDPLGRHADLAGVVITADVADTRSRQGRHFGRRWRSRRRRAPAPNGSRRQLGWSDQPTCAEPMLA